VTRAELRDMRLRAIAGIPLTEREQLALIDASERLVDVVLEWSDPGGNVNHHHFANVGQKAVAIVREVRLS